MDHTELTPLLKVAFDTYNTDPNHNHTKMTPSSDSRGSHGGRSGHPHRKNALQGRLKDIVLLELRNDG